MNFQNLQIKMDDDIEICKYQFDLLNLNFILKDLLLITKQTVIYN